MIVACVVGDGEAETGPLATAWHSNKFLNPVTDGVVLPILHLNGYKISNSTVLARISHEELEQLFLGYGWKPYFVEGDEPETMHQLMAKVMDKVTLDIQQIKESARNNKLEGRPRWPMIIFNSPKGWTGPKTIDNLPVEGTFRSHQVPLIVSASTPPGNLKLLEDWLKSYHPEELFDEQGRLKAELSELAPEGEHRMGANPHTNGGKLLRSLNMPDFREYAIDVPTPTTVQAGCMSILGPFLRDIIKLNQQQRNFRIFSPDETISNRLGAVFKATNRQWDASTKPSDEFLAPEGRVDETQCSANIRTKAG